MTIELLEDKIDKAAILSKCQKCRCFRETLSTLEIQLGYIGEEDRGSLPLTIRRAIERLVYPEYT